MKIGEIRKSLQLSEGAEIVVKGKIWANLQFLILQWGQEYMVVCHDKEIEDKFQVMSTHDSDSFINASDVPKHDKKTLWFRTSGQMMALLQIPMDEEEDWNEAYEDFIKKAKEHFL
jgi:hypothetical protein